MDGGVRGDAVRAAIRIVFDDADAAYPVTIDPLATSPAWTAESDQAYADFGCSVATAGDVNGDGYSDVIVGACGYDNGQTDEGRAYVYHGSAAGLSATRRLDGGERPGRRLLRLLGGDGGGRERGRLLGRDRRGARTTTTARRTRGGRTSTTARRRASRRLPPGRRRATRPAPTSAAPSRRPGT